MTNIELPQIPRKCRICNNENRFAIQKAIDNGATIAAIAREYKISSSSISIHIENNHRENLIAFGTVDYVVRKKAIDVGITLAEYLEKWQTGIPKRTPDTIKDSDAIKAMELYLKSEGNLINKHEITVKKSIEDALKEFLECDENEEEHTKEETGKDDEIEISEVTTS